MKPNPEQDANRAAFEKAWVEAQQYDDGWSDAAWRVWKAAKADSRAMQEALVALVQAKERKDNYGKDDSTYLDMKVEAWAKAYTALSLAAPFHKTGV